MYKNNSRNISDLKVCSPLQLHHKLKDWSSEIGYYSYTHRCASYKKTSNEQNIKIDLPNIHNDPKLFLC